MVKRSKDEWALMKQREQIDAIIDDCIETYGDEFEKHLSSDCKIAIAKRSAKHTVDRNYIEVRIFEKIANDVLANYCSCEFEISKIIQNVPRRFGSNKYYPVMDCLELRMPIRRAITQLQRILDGIEGFEQNGK